jgi:succinate dehydrogenase/fumarate reductase cytochrome b subunit
MVGPPRVGDERAVEAALGRWRTANETLANPVLARDALNGIVKALKTYEEYGDEQGAGIPAQAPRWLVILCAAIFATLVIGAIVWRLYANR